MMNREGRVDLNIKYIEWIVVWMSGNDRAGGDNKKVQMQETKSNIKQIHR